MAKKAKQGSKGKGAARAARARAGGRGAKAAAAAAERSRILDNAYGGTASRVDVFGGGIVQGGKVRQRAGAGKSKA